MRTVVSPRNRSPSPLPEGSSTALEKNWTVKVVFGVLTRTPWTFVKAIEVATEVKMGEFWRLFGPESVSPGSFGVTPLGGSAGTSRLIPRRRVREDLIGQDGIADARSSTRTPSPTLNAIVFPCATLGPPIRLPDARVGDEHAVDLVAERQPGP